MPISRRPARPLCPSSLARACASSACLGEPGRARRTAQRKTSRSQSPPADKPADSDVSRYCANVAPSIAEARIAWQTKRLNELDAQVKQRIADLEKAEAAARDWVAKREAMMKAASDDVVAIYAKMQPESAARQISTMDDRMAAAILGKLKPTAAGAILDEMEAERASRARRPDRRGPSEKKS